MIDNKVLFSVFPTIDEEFDMVCVDAIKIADDDGERYFPLIRYAIRNLETKSITAGLTVRVGFVAESLAEMSEFISTIVQNKLFLVPVSSLGTIYNEDMEELADVDWNDHLSLRGEKAVTEKRYLH